MNVQRYIVAEHAVEHVDRKLHVDLEGGRRVIDAGIIGDVDLHRWPVTS
jgi:hypothetical protein